MAFFLMDSNGRRELVSAKILKKKIIDSSFSDSEYDELLVQETDELENIDNTYINTFVQKTVESTSSLITADSLKNFLKTRISDTKLLSTLFTMQRDHFISIVYMFYTGLIDVNKIEEILEMKFYNRTEIILSLLSQEANNDIDIFRSLKNILNPITFYSAKRDKYSIELFKQYSNYQEIDDISHAKFLIYRSFFKSKDHNIFKNVTWANASNDVPEIKNMLEGMHDNRGLVKEFLNIHISRTVTPPSKLVVSANTEEGTLAYERLPHRAYQDPYIAAVKKIVDNFLNDQTVIDSLEFLNFLIGKVKSNSLTLQNMDTVDSKSYDIRVVIDYLLNSLLVELAAEEYNKNTININDYDGTYLLKGVQKMLSDTAPNDEYDIFEVFEHIHKFGTTDFNNISAGASAHNLQYINDPLIKDVLLEIFKPFTSRPANYSAIDTYRTNTIDSVADVINLRLDINPFNILEAWENSKYLELVNISKNKPLVASVSDYDTIKDDTFENLSSNLTTIFSNIYTEMNRKRSAMSVQDKLYTPFLKEILVAYEAFLKDPDTPAFTFSFSANLMKDYNLLKFVQSFLSNINTVKEYLDVVRYSDVRVLEIVAGSNKKTEITLNNKVPEGSIAVTFTDEDGVTTTSVGSASSMGGGSSGSSPLTLTSMDEISTR